MATSTNELIAGFVVLTLNIWLRDAGERNRPKFLWACWDAVQILIHQKKGFYLLINV
jgi:hypothetical protein